MTTIDRVTQKNGLCIGCGLCAATCPEQAITMRWDINQSWTPRIDATKCTDCGLCSEICPNTPDCISEYAMAAAEAGERFGLQKESQYFIAYDLNPKKRIRSASGGALTAILMYLLKMGEIDGVIASVPVMAPIGKPHYEMRVMRTIKELDEARSSHYHPLSYDKVLKELRKVPGRYAIVGVPCILRGIKRLPKEFRDKIRYTFGMACSKNVTGQFLDCLARQEGILQGETFIANQRDKVGISNANNFNTYFRLPNRVIRRSRFKTAWTNMWRNYFFTPECCLYCPDFYGVDADLSAKDGWGRLSSDPLGVSLLVVRNPELVVILEKLSESKKLFLERCDADEVFKSQVETPKFKHVEVCDRLVWKSAIRRELLKKNYPLATSHRWWKRTSLKYWQFRMMMWLSSFFYTRKGRVPVRKIIAAVHPLSVGLPFVKRRLALLRSLFAILFRFLARCNFIGIRPADHPESSEGLKVLISGGYGYRNTGDEAQLGANISKWKHLCPGAKLTILSPKPAYTESEHGEHAELAPRVVFFNSEKRPDYDRSNTLFKLEFGLLAPHLLLNARLLRAGLPLVGVYPEEVHLLTLIQNADVLYLSGGGYLTGTTLSRLWDNMLLIRLADIFGTPVILSGQTIGIFKDHISRKLAHWGLKKAKLIYLRDPAGSMADLRSISIQGEHVKALFDDALFCDTANKKEVDDCLLKNGVNSASPYAVINVWASFGSRRMAEVCDYMVTKHKLQAVFLPTSPDDVSYLQGVQRQMSKEARIIDYDFDYRITKGIIGKAEICLTYKHHPIVFAMATGVPTISITPGDYWLRKNRGALELFGQEKWVIGKKALFSAGVFERMIDRCLNDRQKIRAQILSYLPAYGEQDGEVIREFL